MMPARHFTIRVPASTANLGPGFDVLGVALSLEMSVDVAVPDPDATPGTAGITISYDGDSAQSVPLEPSRNLVLRTAMEVAGSVGRTLPPSMRVRVRNPIPLGRGLGSSGAAVVAGIALANEALALGMDQQRVLDYALDIEGHPDNITASIMGGFVASYSREHQPLAAAADVAGPSQPQLQQPQSPPTAAGEGLSLPFAAPPHGAGCHVRLPLSPRVRFVVAVPDFELATKVARAVLPASYSRRDVVFNLQRLAVLTAALSGGAARGVGGADLLDPLVVGEAMQDRVHQGYRQHLVPGLREALGLSGVSAHGGGGGEGNGESNGVGLPGLLGVTISGAGPTVLALATDNFDAIGQALVGAFARQVGPDGRAIQAQYMVLDAHPTGLTVEVHTP
ncbi:hypothetical protein HK405_011290 [Cladochytrium tenue]|nr:hypothetical protein HK405_011290 [Cladochytrium tenue]